MRHAQRPPVFGHYTVDSYLANPLRCQLFVHDIAALTFITVM